MTLPSVPLAKIYCLPADKKHLFRALKYSQMLLLLENNLLIYTEKQLCILYNTENPYT